MKRLTQLNRHAPKNGMIGDCWRTCLAMLLGCDHPSEVPHFVELAGISDAGGEWTPGGIDRFNGFLNDFLRPRGLILVDIPFGWKTLEEALEYHAAMNPALAYILSGTSANGCNHAIVCIGGEVFQDPSQDKSGLIGPSSDGYFWTGFLAYQPSVTERVELQKGS